MDREDVVRVEAQRSQGVQIGTNNVQHGYFPRPPAEVEWPMQVGRPPRLAESFQPRAELLKQLKTELADSGSAVLSQVVASGNGGVGKTQIAVSLFNQTRDKGTNLANMRGLAADLSGAVVELEAVYRDSLRVFGADHPYTVAEQARLLARGG